MRKRPISYKLKKNGVDELINKLYHNADIRFIGSDIYKPHGGWSQATESYMAGMLSVVKEIKGEEFFLEFIVEGNETALALLEGRNIQMNFSLTFYEAVDVLNHYGFSYEILFEDEASII